MGKSCSVTKECAMPLFPALPVLPILCTKSSMSPIGISKFITTSMSFTSRPLDATSVARRMVEVYALGSKGVLNFA